MKQDFTKTETAIIQCLEEFLESHRVNKFRGDREWTMQIKKRIASLGENLKFKVAVGGFSNEYEREWLYDLFGTRRTKIQDYST